VATMRHPQVQRIFQRGVAWACGNLPGPDAAALE
jgi:hypothetical protein